MQKPSLGRIVLAVCPQAKSNGAYGAPAIITRVWSDELVNVTVFPDAGPPVAATSIRLVEDEEAAQATGPTPYAVFFPPRVG